MLRRDHSGRQRGHPPEQRYVAGRRPDSPEERERKRKAHEAESELHPASGIDWLTAMQRKDPEKAKRLQQTTRGDRQPLAAIELQHPVKE